MENNLNLYLEEIKSKLGATSVDDVEKLQALWSNYGGIYRLHLSGAKWSSVILKCIDFQSSKTHPRGWATNRSHQRKIESYKIETHFYKQFAATLSSKTKVPTLLFAEKKQQNQLLVLEDLSVEFPALKQCCTLGEAKVVVEWLARFHATFLGFTPNGLWPVGSYWHLATRPDEWKAMQDSPLKTHAQNIDEALNSATFKTIIHGDAKVANFCFSENGMHVAAVDFQYVGGGVGVKDLAYFLGSCFTEEECALYEKELVTIYFSTLKQALTDYNSTQKTALEAEWRTLYPLAWADFNRFLLGWLPGHHKLHAFALAKNQEAIKLIH